MFRFNEKVIAKKSYLRPIYRVAHKIQNVTQLTLRMLLHYFGKLKSHLADMKENANKVHFKCTDFNSSMRSRIC